MTQLFSHFKNLRSNSYSESKTQLTSSTSFFAGMAVTLYSQPLKTSYLKQAKLLQARLVSSFKNLIKKK